MSTTLNTLNMGSTCAPHVASGASPDAFFASLDRQNQLLHHAGQIIGTPFRAKAMLPGVGMDCIHVAAWLYLRTGALLEFVEPDYSLEAGKHLQRSALLGWLESSGSFQRADGVPPADPGPGDCLCFRFRQRVAHHAGVLLHGSQFIHVLEHRRVSIATLADQTYARSLVATYRPITHHASRITQHGSNR